MLNDVNDVLNSELYEKIKNKEFQNIVKHLISNSKSILDIGCGIGDYLKYTNSDQRVVAIEPHAPYIEKAKEAAPWAEILNTDGLSYLNSTDEKFDLILMIDVVEHLEEEDGCRLISEAINHCNNIVFAQIPIGSHEQNEDVWNMGGEYWQTHRTTWDEDKLLKADFNFVQIWKDWYDWEEDNSKSEETSIALYFKKPVVSVVVPSYNQADWQPKTLDSILEQTYPFWEAVIVDDGSTDDTWSVIEEYMKKDKRIRGIRKENGGISSALNTGIKNAEGKYFCWLSSDDLFYSNKLELQIKAYENLDEKFGLVFGQFDLINAEDEISDLDQKKPFAEGLEFPQQLKYDIVDGCTIMIPLEIMRELNGFNPQYKHAQDTEFWFRLAAKGYKFHYIDQKLVKRRIHKEQGFTDFSLDCRYDGYDIVDFYLNHYSFAHFYKNINWTNKEDLLKFLEHLFDMLKDPDCHVNHPVIKDKFWNWLLSGLATINGQVRETILKNGAAFFSSKQNDFYKEYSEKFKKALLNTTVSPIEPKERSNVFHDLYKYDRSKSDYPLRLYNHGIKCEKKWKYVDAIFVFKYLADYPNPFLDKSFEKFTELCFSFQEFRIFVKSFKRKKSILEFDDKTKLLFVWAKLAIGENDVDTVIESISDVNKRESAENFSLKQFPGTKDENILIWNYSVVNYKIEHYFRFRCDNCGATINKRIKFDISSDFATHAYLCTDCYSAYNISDEQMKEHFSKRIKPVSEFPEITDRTPKIAFIMRYTDVIGGGVKVAFNHMEKLAALGCDITVYSDSPYPSWTNLQGKFIRLNDHYEIDEIDADMAVVFSVYDVPKILTKFSPDRIFHICQGYEGYHIGRNYEELRMDKYFYDTLHSFPVKNIVVSKHLLNLFENKFGRKARYIPNSIDFNVFYPRSEIKREKNSILFIGNPFDPLKGFLFLVETLAVLFENENDIEKLHVYALWGGHDGSGDVADVQYPQLKIEFVTGLSSEEVALLMNKVSLLVSCSMYEGFGLPVLEAMACGVPAITTASMGVESFCKDGFNSFIVNYGDKKSFSERITDVLLLKTDVKSLVENGFETALEYSAFNAINFFVNEYSEILKYTFPNEKKEVLIGKYSIDTDKLRNLLQMKVKSLAPHNLSENNKFTVGDLVSVVIPSYNNKDYLSLTIESIIKSESVNLEIIVVDNNSDDETKDYIKEQLELKNIDKAIFNDENRGFPSAVNQGILVSGGKYVLIANNDIVVPNGTIKKLIDTAVSDPQIGIVSGMSNYVSGPQFDENAKYESIEKMHQYAQKVSKEYENQIMEFPRVAFLCTLIKRSVIDKIGGLDERFSPGNFEDDDFCLRSQISGYKTIIAKDAFVHHFGSKSFGKNGNRAYDERIETNHRIFVDKWNADPEGIWIRNEEVKNRNIYYPLNGNKFKQSLSRAIIHSEENDYNLALKEYLSAIETFDEFDRGEFESISFAELLNLAGNIAIAVNNFELSAELFGKLSEFDEENAFFGLGETNINLGNISEAKLYYNKVLSVNPDHELSRQRLTEISQRLEQQTDSDKAIIEAEDLIEAEKFDDAEIILQTALRHNSSNIDALNNLAVLKILTGEIEDSVNLLDNVLQLSPENDIALGNLEYLEQMIADK